jgi:hypothetical protein
MHLSLSLSLSLYIYIYICIKVWLRGAAIIRALFLQLQSDHKLGGRILIAGSGSGALGSKEAQKSVYSLGFRV